MNSKVGTTSAENHWSADRPRGPSSRSFAIGRTGCWFLIFDRNHGCQDTSAELAPEITPKAVFTVTILHRAPNPEGADKFVAYLLGSDGRNLLKEHGLTLQKMEVSGDASAVPRDIKAIVDHNR
jgi:hypothetical protein